MTAEEYAKALEMLHPLEGLEFYLDALKGRAKSIEPRKRSDMILCIHSAEKARRLAVEALRVLLSGSERIEAERRERTVLMLSQARAQGKTEALDLVAEAVADHRRAAEEQAAPEPAKPKPATRRRGK